MKRLLAVLFFVFLLPSVMSLEEPPEISCCSILLETGLIDSTCGDYSIDVEKCSQILADWKIIEERDAAGLPYDDITEKYGAPEEYDDPENYPDTYYEEQEGYIEGDYDENYDGSDPYIEPDAYYGEAQDYPDDYERDYRGMPPPDRYDRPEEYKEEYDYKEDEYRKRVEYRNDRERYEYRERDGEYRDDSRDYERDYRGMPPPPDRYGRPDEYRERDYRNEEGNDEYYMYKQRIHEDYMDDEFSVGIMVEEWIDPSDDDDAQCHEPEILVSNIIGRMQAEFGEDFTHECELMEEEASRCIEMDERHCSMMDRDYEEYCERNEEDHFWECMDRTRESWHFEEYSCEDEWERSKQNCYEYYDVCENKEGFLDECYEDYKRETNLDIGEDAIRNFEQICVDEWETKILGFNCEEDPLLCEGGDIEIDDCMSRHKEEYYKELEREEEMLWEEAEEVCEDRWRRETAWCEDMEQHCDNGAFFDECFDRQEEEKERHEEEMEEMCEDQTRRMQDENKMHCERMEEDRERCYDEAEERCAFMEKKAERCFEMNWELIEENVAKKIKRHCRLVVKSEDHEVLTKLLEVDDEEVVGLDVVIEDNAEAVVEVNEEVDDLKEIEEQKDAIYKVMRFFGLKKAAEQKEVERLEQAKDKMDQAIERLEKASDIIENEEAKLALSQAMQILASQKDDINSLISERKDRATGIF